MLKMSQSYGNTTYIVNGSLNSDTTPLAQILELLKVGEDTDHQKHGMVYYCGDVNNSTELRTLYRRESSIVLDWSGSRYLRGFT